MKVGIIIGSVRQGRVSDKMAAWVAAAAQKHEELEVELLDLKDYQLPFFDEAISPQFNPDRKPEGEVKRWLDALARQDAYIVVTPEYNRTISGVLKNALDFVAFEMAKKPVGIATHGSSNGAQAVAHLRGIVPGLLAVTTPSFIGLPYMVAQSFNDDGTYGAGDDSQHAQQLDGFIGEVFWYAEALAAARK